MINSTSLDELTPATKAKAEELIKLAAGKGITLRVTSTYRDAEYQDSLYAKGRTAPGQKVTNLSGNKSIHTSRQAFDVVPIVNGKADYSTTGAGADRWQTIGQLGVQVGLEWGGNWKSFKDFPHFQIPGAKPGAVAAPPVATKPPAEKPPEEATKPKVEVKDGPVKLKPLPNRLKQYPSYTYGLSLHVLTPDEYSDSVITKTYTPKNVLVASAGRHDPGTFPRNKFFTDDFYFDNFEIVTVIQPSDVSGNSNQVALDFTLIEPYGFTFIERLLDVAKELKSENYLDMPYLIQIDFFAMDDTGNIVGSVPELIKRFPIKFNKLDVKVGVRGAEYRFNASPFAHSAMDSTSISTPANFEVTAGSVAEFFQSVEGTDADTFVQALNNSQSSQRNESAPATKTPKISPIVRNALPGTNPLDQWKPVQKTTSSTNPASKPMQQPAPPASTATSTTRSFGTAINRYYKSLQQDNKISVADVYRFEFLPDPDTGEDIIGKALFTDRLRSTPKETPMKYLNPTDIITMKRSDIGSSQNIYDTSKALFQINYGTTIEKLLEYVIRNSNYIQDQLVIPDGLSKEEYKARKEALKDKPLNWFRIIPTVRPIGFDSIRKIQAREITYTVKPYKIYNIRSDLGPQGVVTNPVKDYNYIYTGKNDDVFDFDISFNALYYMQNTSYKDNLAETAPSGASAINNYEYQNAPNYSGGDPPKGTDYNAVMPLVMKPVIQNSQAVATGGATTAKETAAADLANSIMSSSEADMINLKLKILGDPDYIKQDDVFISPANGGLTGTKDELPEGDPRLLDGGSLVMDAGTIYATVKFRTPVDIDESTGLMDFGGYAKNSIFSGIYSVITVRSTFSNGQFIQELDMTRVPRQQEFDRDDQGQSDNRPAPGSLPGVMGVDSTPAPSTTTDVTGGGPAASTADASDSSTNQTPGSQQPVAEKQAVEEPAVKPDQAALMNTAKTAETAPITAVNEPPKNPPGPNPSEAKEAARVAYFGFLNEKSPEKLATLNYESLRDTVRRDQEEIEHIQANIERMDLRLQRTDVSEELRAQFAKRQDENRASLEKAQQALANDTAKRDELKPTADAWYAKQEELNATYKNTA